MLVGVVAVLAATTPTVGNTAASPLLGLPGSLKVSTRTSIYVAFSLDRPVHIVLQDFQVHGVGRVYGAALRRDGAGQQPTVFMIHDGMCARTGCPPTYAGVGVGCSAGKIGDGDYGCGRTTFPVGRYHLYVVADGGPVTLDLRINGRAGRLSLSSGQPLRATIQTPPAEHSPGSAVDNQRELYATGATHRLASHGGFGYLGVWKQMLLAPKSANAVGACIYQGGVPSGTAPPYQLCGGSVPTEVTGQLDQAYSYATTVGPLPTYYAWFGDAFLGPSGSYGFGGYMDTAMPAVAAQGNLAWFDWVA